ncbi:MAG: hypothetical protein IKS21_03570 [Oscillospiraceae bacterium]|nr:hypothetical protein [Oscillospiraceae bacterium]
MKLEASYFADLGGIVALAALYLAFFYNVSLKLRRNRGWKSISFAILGSGLQLANLAGLIAVFNLRHGSAETVWNAVPAPPIVRQFLIAEGILVSVFLIATGFVVHDRRKSAQTLTTDSIAEAVMNLPSGLCFAAADGRIVLSNTVMRSQTMRITGKPLTDANEAWESLLRASQEPEETCTDSFLLRDGGQTWVYRREYLEIDGKQYQHICSSDLSERVMLVEALRTVNDKIEQQNKRTRRLISEIIIKKSEEEILNMQHRVHHDVGQCIVMAREYLQQPPSREMLLQAIQRWEQTFCFHSDTPQTQTRQEREEEICQSAEFMRCRVLFRGKRPETESYYLLYLSAVREALSNAIRHGKATVVYVDGVQEKRMLEVVISDNSSVRVNAVSEGVGLSVLRKRLEAAGVQMDIDTRDGVRLRLCFPNEVKQ